MIRSYCWHVFFLFISWQRLRREQITKKKQTIDEDIPTEKTITALYVQGQSYIVQTEKPLPKEKEKLITST